MVVLKGVLSKLQKTKVLVIGDLMLDTYTIGKAKRISPEAPVAVVHVHSEEKRAGGAGNVMLNLLSLGAEVCAIGRIGDDHSGPVLLQSLAKEGIDVRGIVMQSGFQTPIKNRIIAENQQIVRVDHECILALEENKEKQIIGLLPVLLDEVQIVALSDYGKGFLTPSLIAAIMQESKKRNIPVIADPKGADFLRYNGAYILKPNLGEAYAAAGMPSSTPLDHIAGKLLETLHIEILMITRSEAGISLFYRNGTREDYPVQAREVKDVTGAGDTVLAILAFALGNRLSMPEAVQLSNIAAGIAIERIGCARIKLSDLARRLLENHDFDKIFDEEHTYTLLQALTERPYKLIGVSAEKGLTSPIFNTIKRLASKNSHDLIIYISERKQDSDFVEMLASLKEVDFILFQQGSLRQLCSAKAPAEVVFVDNDSARHLPDGEDILACCNELAAT